MMLILLISLISQGRQHGAEKLYQSTASTSTFRYICNLHPYFHTSRCYLSRNIYVTIRVDMHPCVEWECVMCMEFSLLVLRSLVHSILLPPSIYQSKCTNNLSTVSCLLSGPAPSIPLPKLRLHTHRGQREAPLNTTTTTNNQQQQYNTFHCH